MVKKAGKLVNISMHFFGAIVAGTAALFCNRPLISSFSRQFRIKPVCEEYSTKVGASGEISRENI